MTASNSYMITNRNDPTSRVDPQKPLPDDNLRWYVSASQANDPAYGNYKPLWEIPSSSAPPAFSNAVVAELQAQASPSLTFFIHGLDSDWSHAVSDTAVLGANLASLASYAGLVIGFSWPSMGKKDLVDYASGYPQPATAGTARGNIMLSLASFGSLIAFANTLSSQVPGLQVNFVCHSEGNYMLMQGLAVNSGAAVNQTVMLAADINNGAFQTPAVGLVGQAAAIATQSSAVTVYHSSNDDTLAMSVGLFSVDPVGAFHNPAFGGRLGMAGPSYNQGPQAAKMSSVDCSAVVNSAYVAQLSPSAYPAGTTLHTSYLYIPQVLQDIAATLTGTAPGSVANRTPLLNAGQYFMSAE